MWRSAQNKRLKVLYSVALWHLSFWYTDNVTIIMHDFWDHEKLNKLLTNSYIQFTKESNTIQILHSSNWEQQRKPCIIVLTIYFFFETNVCHCINWMNLDRNSRHNIQFIYQSKIFYKKKTNITGNESSGIVSTCLQFDSHKRIKTIPSSHIKLKLHFLVS